MFDFTDEQKMVRQMLRRWATDKLEPKVPALEAGEQPYELMRDFARSFGVGPMVRAGFEKAAKRKQEASGDGDDREKSGFGDPALGMLIGLEMSRVCPGFMLAFGASMGLAGAAIMARGTPDQKERWGLPILTFEKVGAWGMTEPGAGSDAFRSMRTVAVPTDKGYVLNGQKTFITNAPYADILLVYAKIDRGDGVPLADRPIQAFVVERGDAGLSVSEPMKKMGMHSSPTGEIFLADCELSADRLLGMAEKPQGRASGKDVFHSERTGMAPMCVGIIERCLEISVDYAQQREAWGKKIAEYQLVQDKLARMFMHYQNVKNLMFKQLWLMGKGKTMSPAEASACKLYAARAATDVALEAVQILGGNGYMQEYRVEMFARDAKLLQIGGGTDEIQILSVARDLLGDQLRDRLW